MRKFDETADVHSKRPDVREPWLVISSASGVRGIPLPRANRVVVGRMHTCDIVIDDESVSRQHAAIHFGPNGLVIEDLGSRNKTRVGGRALGRGETASLSVGAVVEVGYATMFVQMGRPPSSPVSRTSPASTGSAAPIPGSAIVHDPTMQRLYGLLDVIAPSPLNVVILGETGTGKEVFAEAMHKGSSRASRPFLKVNCAALSGSLLESELFGHEKGAFTGATERKRGRLELCDGGTFFLDEVGELKPELQAKLLRVLQERRFERVGGSRTLEVDVRWIAATNRDLRAMIDDGRFREDLYHRLAVFPIKLPPLRERRHDILPLARTLLDRVARDLKRSLPKLSPSAEKRIASATWRGNVRELANTLERAAILADGDTIDDSHIWLEGGAAAAAKPAVSATGPEVRPLADLEKEAILHALEVVGGNRRRAAELLGIGERTLYDRLKKYGVDA